MLIIFVNHIPFNDLSQYTPSRFGLSDASELFVFLSGFAAAIAFGRSFQVAGLAVGSVRVLLRCGQIYAAHLGLFFALAAICVIGNALWTEPDYIVRLNLGFFFDHTPDAVLGLVTLTYVPNYFDILPMYLVVLLWLPLFWALSRIHPGAALGVSIGVYMATSFLGIELPADPLSERPWFFNPFGWQLIFFLGFAFGNGWLKVPPAKNWLIALALVGVVLAIPIGHAPTYQTYAFWGDLRADLAPLLDKTQSGPLRIAHFLCLAYLTVSLLRTREPCLRKPLPGLIATAGQQSLSIFLFGMALSYIGGMALDRLGHGAIVLLLVNLGGIALLLLVAQALAWLGRKPWKQSPQMHGLAVGDPDTLSAATPASRLPWVWTGRFALAFGLVAMAIAPLMLVRHSNGFGTVAATGSGGTPSKDAPLSDPPEYSMSPVTSATVSTRTQLMRAMRSSGNDAPGPEQVISEARNLEPSLMPVSLSTGPGVTNRGAKSRSATAKRATLRPGYANSKGARATAGRTGRKACTTRTLTPGSRETRCVARQGALRNSR